MALGLEIEESSLWSVGDYLRGVNQEIKAALREISGQPVSPEFARALHNLQTTYAQAVESYTTVYRAVYGEVPAGLAALPIGIAAWTAWQWVIAAVVVGGILYTALQTFRNALQVWRDQVRSGVIQALPPAERAPAIEQLFPSGAGDWLSENMLLVAGAALGLMILTRR